MDQTQQQKNRDFICPCAKSYYSYAALFTHIKQKHGGRAPGDIIKPKPKNKRGRPKKKDRLEEQQLDRNLAINSIVSNIDLNQINHYNPNHFQFKISQGSGFRTYQKDQNDHVRTSAQLDLKSPLEISDNQSEKKKVQMGKRSLYGQRLFLGEDRRDCLTVELLEDLRGNIRGCQREIDPDVYQSIESYSIFEEYLKKQQQNVQYEEKPKREIPLILSFINFLDFCKKGLNQSQHHQILTLLLLILQHISHKLPQKQTLKTQTNSILNEHIQDFFQKLPLFIKEYNLQEYGIFQSINAMKILIVYYNWLNTSEQQQMEEDLKMEGVEGMQFFVPEMDCSGDGVQGSQEIGSGVNRSSSEEMENNLEYLGIPLK